MPNDWTPKDLEKQMARAKANDWIKHFEKRAADYQFTPALLMAIASRETNMRNIIGDSGHGFGIMQIDDRSFAEWCHSGLWKDAAAGIQQGALVLDSKRETMRHGQGKTLKVIVKKKPVTFTGIALSPSDLLRTAIAGYNAGLKAYYGLSKLGDPDELTTGGDYSKDVLARQKIFESLL